MRGGVGRRRLSDDGLLQARRLARASGAAARARRARARHRKRVDRPAANRGCIHNHDGRLLPRIAIGRRPDAPSRRTATEHDAPLHRDHTLLAPSRHADLAYQPFDHTRRTVVVVSPLAAAPPARSPASAGPAPPRRRRARRHRARAAATADHGQEAPARRRRRRQAPARARARGTQHVAARAGRAPQGGEDRPG